MLLRPSTVAIGDSGSNRRMASAGLVPSARAVSVQPWPLARASWTSWGRQRSAWVSPLEWWGLGPEPYGRGVSFPVLGWAIA